MRGLEFKILSLLQQCITFKQLKQIHASIITSSLYQNIEISSRLLRKSTEFGGMEYPELIFSHLDKNLHLGTVFMNAMIRGYAYYGTYEKCITMFDEMTQRELTPNNFTYPYVLKALSETGYFGTGTNMHCRIVKAGFECVPSVAHSLFHFYLRWFSRNGKLGDAKRCFNNMSDKPVELWNRMIYEYGNIGEVYSARQLFDEMPDRDVVSWNSMILCSGRAGDVQTARELFEAMPNKNVVSWTTMVGVYAGSGDLSAAKICFEEMPEKNLVSWNSMISNYTHHGKFQEALDLFVRMHRECVDFDGFTLVSALSACAHLGDLEFGKWIHCCFVKDWSQLGVIVGTALIEMYAKCGDVNRAVEIFIKLGQKDVFCWNVLIKSLAIHGRVREAVKSFFMMKKIGLKPNEFTFASVLFACNHGGLVEEGRNVFYSMEREFGIKPNLKHYGSFIDLLGRNGQLEEAYLLLVEMPFEPDIAIWGALLGGCKVQNEFKLAEKVMEKIDELKKNESGVYVLTSNIYASAGQWLEAARAREKIDEKKMRKNAGYSSLLEVVQE